MGGADLKHHSRSPWKSLVAWQTVFAIIEKSDRTDAEFRRLECSSSCLARLACFTSGGNKSWE
jgi:hypothetical protein